MSVDMILAKGYVSITDRKTHLDDARRELSIIVNSQPTQIHPAEREDLIDALLSDLEGSEGAPWTYWPADIHLLCLTALKTLGRNPMGSQNLLQSANLERLLFQTSLPFPKCRGPEAPLPPRPTSLQALEALRVLANLLVLHPAGRTRFAKAGGGAAVAKALAGQDGNGGSENDTNEEDVGRLFLLGRIGFLVTMNRKEVVKGMVDHEDIVNSLVHYLIVTSPIPANSDALSELLKLTNNIIRFYPPSSSAEEWDEKLDPLLWPTLALFHGLSSNDYRPPLTHCLHVLLAFPFIPRLLVTWHSVPADPPSPTTSAAVRGLLSRLGSMSIASGSTTSARKSPEVSLGSSASGPDRSRTPSPVPPAVRGRTTTLPAKKESATAFVSKVLGILERYLDRWLPWPQRPDDETERGPVMDEHLPPIFLLLSRVAAGSEPSKALLRAKLLPPDLDRSSGAGSLEARKGLLGHLLRFMACTSHTQSKNTAGELLWAVCDQDASTLSAEIGYGNAAGVLFQKGLSGPPPGKIQEIPESTSSRTASVIEPDAPVPVTSAIPHRNPITALQPQNDESDPMADWTDEQKEREAERLFAVFDKMDRNPVISTQGPGGEKRGVKEAIQAKYAEVTETWGEKERKEREDEEKKDEEEVRKEMEAYRRRTGKK